MVGTTFLEGLCGFLTTLYTCLNNGKNMFIYMTSKHKRDCVMKCGGWCNAKARIGSRSKHQFVNAEWDKQEVLYSTSKLCGSTVP